MSIQKGHDFANLAEEYLENKEYQKAIEAHFQAADAYLEAVGQLTDPEAIRTLKLLYTNHLRQGKELQRKDTQNIKSPIDLSLSEPNARSPPAFKPLQRVKSESSQSSASSLIQSKQLLNSYLVLDEQPKEDSTFNKFWDAVENLVQKMPTTAAFAVAPLKEEEKYPSLPSSASSSGFRPNIKKRIVNNENSRRLSNLNQESFLIVDSNEKVYGKTIEEYEMENYQLKQTIDILTKRIEETSRISEENMLLKSSIIQFKQDFQNQTKKIFHQILPKEVQEEFARLKKEISRLQIENEKLKKALLKK